MKSFVGSSPVWKSVFHLLTPSFKVLFFLGEGRENSSKNLTWLFECRYWIFKKLLEIYQIRGHTQNWQVGCGAHCLQVVYASTHTPSVAGQHWGCCLQTEMISCLLLGPWLGGTWPHALEVYEGGGEGLAYFQGQCGKLYNPQVIEWWTGILTVSVKRKKNESQQY